MQITDTPQRDYQYAAETSCACGLRRSKARPQRPLCRSPILRRGITSMPQRPRAHAGCVGQKPGRRDLYADHRYSAEGLPVCRRDLVRMRVASVKSPAAETSMQITDTPQRDYQYAAE